MSRRRKYYRTQERRIEATLNNIIQTCMMLALIALLISDGLTISLLLGV